MKVGYRGFTGQSLYWAYTALNTWKEFADFLYLDVRRSWWRIKTWEFPSLGNLLNELRWTLHILQHHNMIQNYQDNRRERAIFNNTEAAEKASRWFWIKRVDSWASTARAQVEAWSTSAFPDVWMTQNTWWPQVTSLMMYPNLASATKQPLLLT